MATLQRVAAAILMIALVVGVQGAALVVPPGLAQAAAWDCAAAPGPASTPAAAPAGASFPEEGGELTVFAAASLTDAFAEIKTELEAAHPGLAITYNLAGSQTLATQLSDGAAADVFVSANEAQMDVAIEAGVIAGDPVTVVRNRLVVIVPAANPAGLTELSQLADDGVQLVLAQPDVPVGQYARQSLCLMAESAAEGGEDFVSRVAANVVSEEDDVRDVLVKVQLGEADAGIVYVSDAFVAGDDVGLIEIPDAVNVLATYPMAPVVGGDAALAAAFMSYLLDTAGQATLESYGFAPAP